MLLYVNVAEIFLEYQEDFFLNADNQEDVKLQDTVYGWQRVSCLQNCISLSC